MQASSKSAVIGAIHTHTQTHTHVHTRAHVKCMVHSPIAKPSSVKAAPVLFFLFSFSLQLMECSTKFTVYGTDEVCCGIYTELQVELLSYSAVGSDGKHRPMETTAVSSGYLDTDQWRDNHVEVSQVHVLGATKLWCKHVNEHLEVLGSLC